MRTQWMVHAAMSVVLAAAALLFRYERETERSRADALLAQYRALESQRSTTPARPPPPAPEPVPRAQIAPVADDSSAAAEHNPGDDYHATMLRLLRDPKYYEAKRASLRLSYAERRDEMIRVLGLSAARADAIVDDWIDRHLQTQMRVLASSVAEPGQRETPEMWAQQDRESEGKLRATLGDETFARLQEYTASRPSRDKANQLRTRLAAGNQDLRDDQFEPLIAALHTETARFQREAKDYIGTQDPDTVYTPQGQSKAQEHLNALRKSANRRLRDSLATILSASQLAAYEAMEREELEGARARNTVQSMEASAGGN